MWHLSSNPTTTLSCITTVLVIIFTIFIFTTRKKMVISFFTHTKKAYGGEELSNPHPSRFTLGKTVPPLKRRLYFFGRMQNLRVKVQLKKQKG